MSITPRAKNYLITALILSIIAAFYQFEKIRFNDDYRQYSKKIAEIDKVKMKNYSDLRDAEKQNDLKKCEQLKSGEKNACFLSYSLRNFDLTACTKISIPQETKDCEDMVNTAIYLKNESDLAKCSSLNSTSSSKNCFLAFISAWLSSGAPDKCHSAALPLDYQKICQDRFTLLSAVSGGTATSCDQIIDNNLKDQCRASIKNLPIDSDHDGLSDRDEKSYGTDPHNPDTDGDGLSDGDEINKYHTNPLKKDTDGDGLSDKNEILLGTDPHNPDTDGDGYTDGFEISHGFNPCGDGPLPAPPDLKIMCAKYVQKNK